MKKFFLLGGYFCPSTNREGWGSWGKIRISWNKIHPWWESKDLHINLRQRGTSSLFLRCLFLQIGAGGDPSQCVRLCVDLASKLLQMFDDALNTEQNCQSLPVLPVRRSTNLSMDLDRRLERSMFPPLLFFWSLGNIILVALDISVPAPPLTPGLL